jgi:uncharacterized protein (DUF2062 family)
MTEKRSSFFARRRDGLKALAQRAWAESPSPHRRAISVASGVLVSASPVPPVLGLRTFATIALATLLRGNRLLALVGAQLFIGPLWLFAVVAEVRLGAAILGRTAPAWSGDRTKDLQAAWDALSAWLCGAAVIAPGLALGAYLITRGVLAVRRSRASRDP